MTVTQAPALRDGGAARIALESLQVRTARPFRNSRGGDLLPEDYTALAARWITPELADGAAIRRVDGIDGKALVNRKDAGEYAGLVIPYCLPGDDQARSHRLRRDKPDLEHRSEGDDTPREVRKYVTAPGSPNLLYFPPLVDPALLKDVDTPVIITEGEFKTLALWRLAHHDDLTPRFLPIGLSGVWNWRGTIGKTTDSIGRRRGVKGVIPDFDLIRWQGRTVLIAFDADAATNEGVAKARSALTRELMRRGARVAIVEWPAEKGKGIDDYLAGVGPDVVLGKIDTAQPIDEWRSELLMTAAGKPKGNLANGCTFVRMSPEWAGILRYDEFKQRITTQSAPPWGSDPIPKWGDQESRKLGEWLAHNGIEVTTKVAYEVALTVATENRFDSLSEYIDSLPPWDGVRRIDRLFSDYLGAEDSEYVRMIGSKFLIMLVARASKPGCKADYMPVLEGPQAFLKSTALKTLMPFEAWFSDELPDLGTKDAYLQLNGVWLMEAAEFDTFSRASATKAKSFMTSSTDRYRPPYAISTDDFPRRTVLAATANTRNYLKDETGGRRFWPVVIDYANRGEAFRRDGIRRLKEDRDQLFAEAKTRYLAGESWWPDGSAQTALAEIEQAERYDEDVWTSVVREWIARPMARAPFDHDPTMLRSSPDRVLIDEILTHAVGKPPANQNRFDQMRVAAILTHDGWTKKKVSVGKGIRLNFYVPATELTN